MLPIWSIIWNWREIFAFWGQLSGMSYALSQIIDLLVSDIDGIHLYTMNNPLVARRICDGIRNII